MNLLETKSLAIGYRLGREERVIQQDISVQVKPGEIVSLMGQNGVGKTTFIKTVSGLLPALGGEVYYGEMPLNRLSNPELARTLSLVLTDRSFSYNLSVLELITLGRHPYSGWMGILTEKDKQAIEWAITETHTNYLVNKKLYELSDGQLQKVLIARALAQETDLIILDEPAAHLDLYNKIEVMTLLRKIAGSGKGILISTHDMQISTQLSDRLWLFNFNEPVEVGLPEDLILSGSLEKTLYLQELGYDMIHGAIRSTTTGPEVRVEGPEAASFWAKQALRRNGFSVSDNAPVSIIYAQACWRIRMNEQEISVQSIEEVLEILKTLPRQ